MSDIEVEPLSTLPVDNAWELKIPEFKPENNPHGLLEESSFATLFPKVIFVMRLCHKITDIVKTVI